MDGSSKSAAALASLSSPPTPSEPAPAYEEAPAGSSQQQQQQQQQPPPPSLRAGPSTRSTRKPVPLAAPAPAPAPAREKESPSPYRSQAKPLPIPYQPPAMAAYPPSEPYPNPYTTRSGQHDYTDAYNTAVAPASSGSGNGYGYGYGHGYAEQDNDRALASAAAAPAPAPAAAAADETVPATGPTKGVGVPSSYNAFISFPLLSPWYPSSAAKPGQYYDPTVSGPRSYPPPLEARGLTESRFMQIQHFACSIRADSQRNKGLLCCGLGVLLGGLGCVLIDNKCVGNKPLRDQVNRWAFENVNPRLEHEGIEIRFAYQKGMLRAYFKDQ